MNIGPTFTGDLKSAVKDEQNQTMVSNGGEVKKCT